MNALFLTLRWVSVLALPNWQDTLDRPWMILLGLGGLLYTFGAFIVGLRKPDPWPSILGTTKFGTLWL